MAFKLTGTVLHIGDVLTLSSKSGTTFTKRDLVITVRKFDPYTGVPSDDPGNTPKFTFINANCEPLNNFKIGDIVTVSFDINGRSYEKDGRIEYFTDIRPFKVDIQRNIHQMYQEALAAKQDALPINPTSTPSDVQTAPQDVPMTSHEQSDDLPF